MENLENNQAQNQTIKSPILSNLTPIQEKINQTTNEFNEALEENKKPKRRGRPKKVDQEKVENTEKLKQNAQYEKMVGSILDFAGNYLASATNYGGFKLKPDEKQVLAEQGAEVMLEFAPMIEGKYVKLGIFATTMVSIYGVKFYGFQAELAKQMIEENKSNE